MATKTKSRKTSKGKRSSGWAWFFGGIGTLAVIAGTVLLILEFCTAYKPSNGFKKVVPDTEQTETLPDDKGNGGEELPAGGEDKKPEQGDQGSETKPVEGENGGGQSGTEPAPTRPRNKETA